MGGEPRALPPDAQDAPDKEACALAMETVSPHVRAPGATSGAPAPGESLAVTEGGAPASDGGRRPEGERQRKGPLPASPRAASARAAGGNPAPAWRPTMRPAPSRRAPPNVQPELSQTDSGPSAQDSG
eukprot:964230-Pyramimonas_sp.AAC.1